MTPPVLSETVASLVRGEGGNGARHHLPADPRTCYWGYIDAAREPVLTVDPGDIVEIETVTHRAGDAPDLLMDDAIRALWDGIAEH
jgi:hypothetical protein